jgi:AcrR family transcriptional regulator
LPRGRTKGDHSAKRADVAKAACEVILQNGLTATSLSDIARAMGCTTGVIRHYFSDKEELLLFAKNSLFDQSFERAKRAADSSEGLEKLRAMAHNLVPLDSEGIDRYRLLATFNGHAIGNARLMKLQHRRNEKHWNLFAEIISDLQDQGVLSDSLDASLEACALVAMADGLADQVIMSPRSWSSRQLASIIDRYVDDMPKHGVPGRKRG